MKIVPEGKNSLRNRKEQLQLAIQGDTVFNLTGAQTHRVIQDDSHHLVPSATAETPSPKY